MAWSIVSHSIFRYFNGGVIMRCLSCNCNLSDREANRKYDDWENIKNPESRYIMLCDDCILDTDLAFQEDPRLSDEDFEDTDADDIPFVQEEVE